MQALVVAPTREIAIQISDVIKLVGKSMKLLKVCVFVGGYKVKEDKSTLSKGNQKKNLFPLICYCSKNLV